MVYFFFVKIATPLKKVTPSFPGTLSHSWGVKSKWPEKINMCKTFGDHLATKKPWKKLYNSDLWENAISHVYFTILKLSWNKNLLKGIYLSSFTNVRFWTKIEFLNFVKCRWWSWGVVSSTTGSWQSPGRGFSKVNLWEILFFFTSGGQINSLRQKKLCKIIFFECTFKANML